MVYWIGSDTSLDTEAPIAMCEFAYLARSSNERYNLHIVLCTKESPNTFLCAK